MNENEVGKLFSIDAKLGDVANDIVEEDNIENLKKLMQLFNLNQAKKNALRVMKLNSLLDKVQDSMIDRFEKRPGEFSNTDLINYMNTVQSAVDRANKSLTLIDESPIITLNQVNVNVNEDPILNRESREKITNAINALMKLNLENKEQQVENIIIEEEKEENGESSNLDRI